MAKLRKGTWVIVADSGKALLLRTVAEHPAPVFEVIGDKTPDQSADDLRPTDQSGRRADKGPNQRSAVEEPHWRDTARELFAGELSDMLNGRAGEYDRLVLVAAPKVLGALRKALPRAVADKVVAEIDKDLTGHPVRKLETLIAAELAES